MPCGQKRFRVGAPDFGLSRGRAENWGALPIRNGRQARRENGKRTVIYADRVFNRRRRQVPARGLAAVCAHSRPERNESQPVCPLLVGQAGVYFEPTALAAGTAGPAGSARTRSRDQSLENPFLGNRSSPNRRRRQAPARGLAAVNTPHRPNRTEPQHTRPLLVGRVCVNPAPKALAAGTAGWPAALPPFVIFSSRHLPFSARFTMVYL